MQIIYVWVVLDGQTNFCKVYSTQQQAEEYLQTVVNPQKYVIQETQLLDNTNTIYQNAV